MNKNGLTKKKWYLRGLKAKFNQMLKSSNDSSQFKKTEKEQFPFILWVQYYYPDIKARQWHHKNEKYRWITFMNIDL